VVPSFETISSLGENESLRRTIARLNLATSAIVGPGDDAAVVAAADGRFCVTTDTMVEGHDFRLDWSTGYDLGFKAVASNVADIAAMGAKPTALVVALCAPGDTSIEWLEAFADGLREACQALAPGAAVVGGDLTTASQVVIAVTAHGDLEGRQPVLRSGAKPGDVIAVGGTLGKAAAGLALLESGNLDAISSYDELVGVQLRPQPPIALGVAASLAGATSMLDLSDGLSRDLARICKASEVSANIESILLQGYEAMLEQAAQAIGADEADWVLHGGEDHSLLATFSPESVLPRGFKKIGTVSGTNSGELTLDGKPFEIRGWDSAR
jgi:thiamine-monophosphate kinase